MHYLTEGVQPTRAPRRRARVVHLLPQDLNRGAQIYAAHLRDALADDPTQEHLVVSLFAARPAALRPDFSLDVMSSLFRHAGLDPRAVLRLRRLLRRLSPAVTVAHGGEVLKYAVAAHAAQIVYYRVGLSTAELTRTGRTTLYRALARRATRVVGVSQTVRDQLATVLGVPAERLAVIPNSRDPEIYHPPKSALTESEPLVLFIGQLERGKRPNLFLDVIETLRTRGIAHRGAVVGDGALRPSLVTRATSLGVELLGVRRDVPDVLRSASVLVMTSDADTEGMPGVLIEAGLTGVPVVTTPAAGARDVVDDGVTGFVVEPATAEGLADRVEMLLSDPVLRARMGTSALERCREQFTIEATAHQWHQLVEGLL